MNNEVEMMTDQESESANIPEAVETDIGVEQAKQPEEDALQEETPVAAVAEEEHHVKTTRRKKTAQGEDAQIEVKPKRKRKTAEEKAKVSEPASEEQEKAGEKRAARRGVQVVSIDGHRTVETQEDREKNDLIDLIESLRAGKILSGTIQGIERASDSQSLAVIYHGAFKVVIPEEQAVEPPEDYREQSPADVFHYLLTKRLGAEVDYIVKGIDQEANVAVASRLDAMRARRKQYYFGTDRDGNHILYPGQCAEARVVSVIRAGIFVDLFGLEIYVPARELSYQRVMNAAEYYSPGQRILVKILEIDRIDKNHVKASVSVKQATENPYEKALQRYTVDNRYVGTVSMVDTNGVFVALDGGVDCLCSYPKRGRPPRGARVTVRILGINRESNRIWGAITHISVPR